MVFMRRRRVRIRASEWEIVSFEGVAGGEETGAEGSGWKSSRVL